MKYKILKEQSKIIKDKYGKDHIVYRIQALENFKCISSGNLGGWIESEKNLSQYGTCWIYGDAIVYEDARVVDEAHVFGKAKVFGYACISGESKIYGYAKISHHAQIKNKTDITNYVHISGHAIIGYGTGITEIRNHVKIYGSPKIGNADIRLAGYTFIY